MSELEDAVTDRVLMEASKNNICLMRNNVGAFTNESGRHMRFGLANLSAKQSASFKSSDYIGMALVTITPAMVGKTVAIFTAIEMKKEDWKPAKNLDKREQAQSNFIDFVRSKGGIAGFTNGISAFNKIIAEFKTWLVS